MSVQAADPSEVSPSKRLDGRPTAWLPPVLAALVAFAAYLATLSRGVLGGDAGELQFVPPILGLPHPTGYPLQVLLHKAWSLAPIGSVAYRLNLLDAGFAAVAIGLIAGCGRILVGGWIPALLGASAFAFGELWWDQAVSGDKYTLNALFLALVLLLFFRWRSGRDHASLGALAFTYGLSLTHHRSMLLVGPALLVGLLLEGWRPRPWRKSLVLVGLAVAPLVLYLYVPWAASRGLPPGAWRVDTPGAFLDFLLDRGYTSQIRPDIGLGGRVAEESAVLFRSFGPLGVILGLMGLGGTAWRDWKAAAVLVLVFVPQALLGASYLLESHYALPRHWVFYLPAFLVWSLWLAAGVDFARRSIEQLWPKRGTQAALLAGATFLALQAATVWTKSAESMVRAQLGAETLDGYRQDLQRSPLAERFGRLALDSAAPGAVIVCDWEQATALWYFQQAEGERPDITVRYPIERVDESLAAARRDGRPLYVSRSVPELASRGVPSSAGPLIQLLPPPGAGLLAEAVPIDGRLEGGIALVGFADATSEHRPGSVLPLTLFWRAERPVEHDYAVSVRLAAADQQAILAQHDERHPALGTSPTSRWRPGDVIGDYHELPLGNRLAPGRYRVLVVMYQPEPVQNLPPVDRPQDDFLALPPFEVKPRELSPFDLLVRLSGG
ncbi:MAG TPA: DUF2723 domain-containing protein [Chloroflexota bacterium]|nr:DUF2723 domain-containing protein [Chloroflexota bacterium]